MGYNIEFLCSQKLKDFDGILIIFNGLITMGVSEKIQLFSGLNFPLALASLIKIMVELDLVAAWFFSWCSSSTN